MTPEISIIIPTKNGKKHLEQTLPETIKACRNASVKTEIIVVDDNSEDGTLKLKKDYPQIKFLKNPSKGVCSARNRGVLESHGNILLFIDNDVFLNEDFFAPTLKCFTESFFAAACCGYSFLDGHQLDGVKTLSWSKGFPRFTGNILNDKLKNGEEYLSFGVQGAYFFCSKERFKLLNGFDPLLEPYMLEETDLAYRGLKRGWKINYIAGTKPLHKCGGTIQSKTNPKTKFLSKRNRYIFIWKNISDPFLLASHLFWLILRLPLDFKAILAAGGKIKEILIKRKQEKAFIRFADREILLQSKQQRGKYAQ